MNFRPGILLLLLSLVANIMAVSYIPRVKRSDPNSTGCQTHRTLQDPWRNIGLIYKLLPFESKNDSNLTEGWYNFSGVGGNQMVQYCSNISPNKTLYSPWSDISSADFHLYTCSATAWRTNVSCGQNITSVDCGGGLVIYYLLPTNGLYASRHSPCNNSSCGEHAQCILPYGSCACEPGFSLPDGFVPTGESYECTDIIIIQSAECRVQFTASCALDVLSQFQKSTGTVTSTKVTGFFLNEIQTSANVLKDTTDPSKLVSYGNTVVSVTQKLLSLLATNMAAKYTYSQVTLTNPSLEATILVCGSGTGQNIAYLNTSSDFLAIDLTGISNAAVALVSYGKLSNMLQPSFFNPTSTTNKTIVSNVVSATLLIATPQLKTPVNLTLRHISGIQSNLSCVFWNNTGWTVAPFCNTIYINDTHTQCSCSQPSTFSLIMQTDYFKAASGAELMDAILKSPFTQLTPTVVTEFLGKVMNDTTMSATSGTTQVAYAKNVLLATEKLVTAMVTDTDTNKSEEINLKNLAVRLFMLGPGSTLDQIPQLITQTAFLDVDLVGIARQNNGSAAVAFMSYISFSSLSPDLFLTPDKTMKTMMSSVVSATLLKANNTQLTKPVNFTLMHTDEVKPDGNLSCVYWENNSWVENGCSVIETNTNHTVCSCVHLSTFALIMQTNPPQSEDNSLDLLNMVLVAVGLVFLSLALLTFAFCQRNQRVNNSARINLCISLLLAHLLFLLTQKYLPNILSTQLPLTGLAVSSGNPAADDKHVRLVLLNFIRFFYRLQLLCKVLAGVLHFLFLSAFVWMFFEGVLLFISVKNLRKIKSNQNKVLGWKCLLVIGYTVPLVVVGVSVGLFPDGYGSDQCWIKTDKNFVWSFLGPVCFILIVNLVLFFIIIMILRNTLQGTETQRSQIKQIKILVFKTLVQSSILGCPWILGFFTQGSQVLEIVFLFLNSQQGTFIFLVHCVLNQEVRQQYRKWMKTCCPSCFNNRVQNTT